MAYREINAPLHQCMPGSYLIECACRPAVEATMRWLSAFSGRCLLHSYTGHWGNILARDREYSSTYINGGISGSLFLQAWGRCEG